jgi:ethanolamine utilization protein EutA (predicted chaperonin)
LHAAAAFAVAATVSGCGGGHDSLSRPPTRVERAALQQAAYDFVVAHSGPSDPSITKMRVSSVHVASGRAASYTAFARVDLIDPDGGWVAALLGERREGRISGWRVIVLGSALIGCSQGRAVYGSHKQAVLRSLGLSC